MNERFFSRLHTDVWGFGASTVCAVHCGMLPFVLTFSSLGSIRWLSNPWIELGFIVLSAMIATLAIGQNFRQHKHIRLAIQVVLAGFALILAGHFLPGSMEYILTALGGATVATGHVLNWRLARKSVCCTNH